MKTESTTPFTRTWSASRSPVLLCFAIFSSAFAVHCTQESVASTDDDLAAGKGSLAVSMSYDHTCAVSPLGVLKCWGKKEAIGFDITEAERQAQWEADGRDRSMHDQTSFLPSKPTNVGAGRTVQKVFAGPRITCAILDNGTLKCFGMNSRGQLGNGTFDRYMGYTANPEASEPIDFGPGRTVKDVSISGWSIDGADSVTVCAVLDDGSLKCWGDERLLKPRNAGQRDPITRPQTVDVGVGKKAVRFGTGVASHRCVILDDGALKCWGNAGSLALGIETPTERNADGHYPQVYEPNLAVDLGPGRTAKSVTVGEGRTCALLDDNSVKCWGSNFEGEIGNGTYSRSLLPGAALDLGVGRIAKSISSGLKHTCALLDDNSVKCWGRFGVSRLAGWTDDILHVPTQVDLGRPGKIPQTIACGYNNLCITWDDGILTCFGSNHYKALGVSGGPHIPAPGKTVDIGF